MSRCPSMGSLTKKVRLMIADDHQLVRDGIRALLKANRNFEVVAEAADGSEAVDKANAFEPDLAVLDITMPVLDGLEATSRIRAASPATKILILTMHESHQMVKRVLGAGALGYVLKSDLASQLVKAVVAVAQGRIFLTPKVSKIVLDAFIQFQNQPEAIQSDEYEPSSRERDVIRLLAQAKSNKEISSILGIATRTVETHRSRIMMKLRVHSLVELVRYADSRGIR